MKTSLAGLEPAQSKSLWMVGRTFGHLKVLRVEVGSVAYCLCACGNEIAKPVDQVKRGRAPSCGCVTQAMRSTKHGGRQTPMYRLWASIKTRCFNPNIDFALNYSGRGIKMHPLWVDSFEIFRDDLLREIGPRPSPKHSIDRIDNDGNYEPGNLRWATQREQNLNNSRARWLTANGERLRLEEWAQRLGVAPQVLRCRLHHGWSEERTATTPKRLT
jgi:hypothetical protein